MTTCVHYYRGRECGKPATYKVGTVFDTDGFCVCEEHMKRYGKDFYYITNIPEPHPATTAHPCA